VKRATEALVMEAQKVHSFTSSYSQEESTVTVDERMVGSMAQVRISRSMAEYFARLTCFVLIGCSTGSAASASSQRSATVVQRR